MRARGLLAATIVLLATALAWGDVQPDAPTRWVTDTAAFLTPATRDALDAQLEAYQHKTGHQLVVWIGQTTAGVPIDDWAVRAFATWHVGRRGLDDGLAVFVFADDHTVRIEVGYGLEPRVTDALVSRLLHEVTLPRIHDGDRDGALRATVDALVAAIGDEGGAVGHAVPDDVPAYWHSPVTWVALGVLALLLLVLMIRYPALAWWIGSALLSSRRGGGGGGFRGGGGRSGGGGGSGSW